MTDVVGHAIGVTSLALNKLAGVTATVNDATEQASVRFAAPVAVVDLVRAVEKAGCTAEPPAPELIAELPADDPEPGPDPALLAQRTRLLVCAALTAPVVAMAMIPALQSTPGRGRR